METEISTGARVYSILLVEDTFTQAMLMQHTLKKAGYKSAIARSGEAALSALEVAVPDLILSDVNMPEVSGYDLCKQIKNDPRFSAIPVVLLVTPLDAADILSIVECQADDIILKSYPEPVFLAKVKAIIEQCRYRQQHPNEDQVDVTYRQETMSLTVNRTKSLNLLVSCYEMLVRASADSETS